MREQLIQYVELLFAGNQGCEDIKQEILQNTLDRYDDLISQGKSPNAAYSLAISGIGDVSELLGKAAEDVQYAPSQVCAPAAKGLPVWKKILRAAAVFLYIISVIPLIVLSELHMEIIGLCGTIAIVAVATVLTVLSAGGKEERQQEEKKDPLQKSVSSLFGVVGLCVYLLLSFSTGAWHITWLIFPIMGAVKGLARAILDLKEAAKHEA